VLLYCSRLRGPLTASFYACASRLRVAGIGIIDASEASRTAHTGRVCASRCTRVACRKSRGP
jgi:hypothetical protein